MSFGAGVNDNQYFLPPLRKYLDFWEKRDRFRPRTGQTRTKGGFVKFASAEGMVPSGNRDRPKIPGRELSNLDHRQQRFAQAAIRAFWHRDPSSSGVGPADSRPYALHDEGAGQI